MQPNISNLKILYTDIINGYTYTNHPNFGSFFIKHLGLRDTGLLEAKQNKFYQQAIKEGLPTTSEQEQYLIQEGLWNSKKDREIFDCKNYVKNLIHTRSKLFRSEDKKQLTKEIEDYEAKIKSLTDEKNNLMGITADDYALKRINELFIYFCLFKDEELSRPLFTYDEFDELSSSELVKLVDHYNTETNAFQETSLKKIALSPFCLNLISMADSPRDFYGVPIVKLTFYQTELYQHGMFFKHIFSDASNRPPPEIVDDPERLLAWHEAKNNAQQMANAGKKPKKLTDLVGLSAEDRELIGIDGGNDALQTLATQAAINGGEATFEQMMNVMGIQQG